MTYSTKTIDQRLRTQANEHTKRRVQKCMEGLRSLARVGTDLKTGDGKPTLWGCIELIENVLIKHYTPIDEEEAVTAFLNQVEHLADQVEELRSRIGG